MSILEQIIQDMYIDPELLEQMGEEHKQVLFRKIREEQVRRWRIKDEKVDVEKKSQKRKKSHKKKVDFLLGANKEPWVWVMGDHVDDLPYEKLVNRRETLKQEEENYADYVEAKELAKKGIMALMDADEADGSLHLHHKLGLASIPESPEPGIIRTESQIDTSVNNQDEIQRQRDTEKIRVKKLSIMGVTPEERQKFEKERVEEVLGTLRRTKSIVKKRSEEMAKKLEDTWRESQMKANIYERSRRRSFKRALEMTAKTPNIHEKILEDIPSEKKKEIVRRMSIKSKPPARPAPAPPKKKLLKMTSFVELDSTPKTSAHVVNWFKTTEAPKGVGKERDGSISVWFHGKIGRDGAVKVLQNEPAGSYLVRLSAKLWGYTVSVKTYEGCRHFLIDASSGQYTFLGPKQQIFRILNELLQYYKTNPITWEGKEFLSLPVGIEDDRSLHGGLYSDSEDDEDGSTL